MHSNHQAASRLDHLLKGAPIGASRLKEDHGPCFQRNESGDREEAVSLLDESRSISREQSPPKVTVGIILRKSRQQGIPLGSSILYRKK